MTGRFGQGLLRKCWITSTLGGQSVSFGRGRHLALPKCQTLRLTNQSGYNKPERHNFSPIIHAGRPHCTAHLDPKQQAERLRLTHQKLEENRLGGGEGLSGLW